nr:type II secretion system protein GspL [uncultured Sphingomonas sp.]
MTSGLLLLLPARPAPGDTATCWWQVLEGTIVDHGSGTGWQAMAAPPTGGPALPVIALAPVAAVGLGWPDPEGATDRQRLGIARAASLAEAMADPATLHAAAGMVEGRLVTARVGNGDMVEWLDWLAAQGIDPLAIVPAGLLLPRTEQWTSAALGPEGMLGRGQLVVPDEPVFRDTLVGGEEVSVLTEGEVAERLALLARTMPLDLRSGRFAKSRMLVFDWGRMRELAALALLIPLLGLLMAVVLLTRLNQASGQLEAETARLAGATLGQSVTASTAASALDSRISELPGASGSPFPPLAALYQHLQAVPGARASLIRYRADGTLSASIAAGRVEEINRLLLALQRSGYRVTATTRAGDGGQVIADLALRSAE